MKLRQVCLKSETIELNWRARHRSAKSSVCGTDPSVVLFIRKCYARAFDNASDCYVQMVHSWHKMVSFQVGDKFQISDDFFYNLTKL